MVKSKITLCSKDLCTGCWACYNACGHQAITMNLDEEGFAYPVINEDLCVHCGLCRKSCPVFHPVEKHCKAEKPIASFAKDLSIRQSSSSGGIFSVLGYEVIKRGGVVFGVVFKDIKTVVFTEAVNPEEMAPMRGSKYMQSSVGDTFRRVKNYLKQNRYVLFVGTPCQVAGLKSYLGDFKSDKLILVDFVCHGVPSSKAFCVYIDKLIQYKKMNELISEFRFRNFEGWGYSPSFQCSDSKWYTITSQENLFMRLFIDNYILRPSCYKCRYTTPERISDLTIADFWKLGTLEHFKYDTSSGVSLVLLNTELGKSFYSSIKHQVIDEERTWREAMFVNHQLYCTTKKPRDREKAFLMLWNNSYTEIYHYFYASYYARVRNRVRQLLKSIHNYLYRIKK